MLKSTSVIVSAIFAAATIRPLFSHGFSFTKHLLAEIGLSCVSLANMLVNSISNTQQYFDIRKLNCSMLLTVIATPFDIGYFSAIITYG